MTRQELIDAMDAGKDVRWASDIYLCYRDSIGQYLNTCTINDSTIGIFHRDGIGMNIDPADCYVKYNAA